MTYAIILIVLAGIAEHFKDLSEEGKLSGYWDKNHLPMWRDGELGWNVTIRRDGEKLWWKVHWLQGPAWDWIPVWIRQYLSFRDGWHLLKFFSLTLGTAGMIWLGFEWIARFDGFFMYTLGWFIARCAFSLPETILRWLRQ